MKRGCVALVSSLLILCTGAWLFGQAKSHELKLTPANIHWGYYDAKVKPVLRIAPGDTVRVETMIARGLERARLAGAREDEIPDAL
jgi:hypothetical protein